MGVPRSNSPNTVSHRASQDGVKKLNEYREEELRVVSHHKKEEQHASSQQVENVTENTPRDIENQSQDIESTQRFILKKKLKDLLFRHNGCTKHKEVVRAIKELSEYGQSIQKSTELEWFPGDFLALSSPNFPGRIKSANGKDQDVMQYTLGRLSFNIFQPNDLVCTVKSVRNPVHPQRNEDDGTSVFSYHFIVDIIIHTPDGDLDATLINRGFCRKSEGRRDRMEVTFTGGTLIPGKCVTGDVIMLKLWNKTFSNAYEKAKKERSYFGWVYHYCMKLFLGLTFPTDSRNLHDYAFHFDMKRPPKGFFDVLYLDDDMRITKGNRGTISILERGASNAFAQ